MDLGKLRGMLWRQRIVVGAVLFIGCMLFALTATKGQRYSATATILAVSSSGGDSAVLDPSKDPTKSAIAPQDLPSLLRSTKLLQRVAAKLHLNAKQAAALGGDIKARTSLGSDVIPVTVTDRDPRRAVTEANAVTQALQRFEQEIVMSRYDLLIGDLRTQLSAKQRELHGIEQQIADRSTADPYVSAETGTSAINARLVAIRQQRDQLLTTTRGDASAAAVAAQRPQLARALASREIVQGDPVLQGLRTQLGKDTAQLTVQRAGYLPDFPGLNGLQDQVSREAASVAETERVQTSVPLKSPAYVAAMLDKNKADAAYASDRAQLAALDRQIADVTNHLQDSQGTNLSLASLRRDRDAGTQTYAQLAGRLAAAIADRSQSASIQSIVVLDEASSASPTLLSRPLVLGAIFGVVFLWLALTLAFVADGADTRLRDRTTIEELYGSPVLTSVG